MVESEENGDNVEASCASMSKQDWTKILVGGGMEVVNSRTLRHQGKPAFLVVIRKSNTFEGKPMYSAVQMLSICTGPHMVKLSCNSSSMSPELAETFLKEKTPYCERYYKSLLVRS